MSEKSKSHNSTLFQEEQQGQGHRQWWRFLQQQEMR